MEKKKRKISAELLDLESKEWQLTPELFNEFLDNNEDERSALKFFTEYPWPIFWTLCSAGGHLYYMFKEFPLGSNYVCDFVIVNCFSGVWEIKFIEFEPIGSKLFTESTGVFDKRLNGAIKQASDWKAYYQINRTSVINDLCSWMIKKDILGYCKGYENPSNNSGNLFKDPNTFVRAEYFIFIGRSSKLSAEQNTRKGRATSDMSIEICTYDRLQSLIDFRYPMMKRWKDVEIVY